MFGLPKLLIAGANGQLGYELVAVAQEEGFDVVALDHEQLDVLDYDAVASVIESNSPQYVINATGRLIPQQAGSPADFTVNSVGPEMLARACKSFKLPLIHISCAEVFDGEWQTPYIENQQQNPVSAYSDSIIQGEKAVRLHLEKHLIIRSGWVFSGRGQCPVRHLLELARKHKQVPVSEGLKGCPTAASDVARVVLALVKQFDCGIENWGTYHYCSSEPISWFGFCEAVIAAARQYENLELEELMTTPDEQLVGFARPANSMLDCTSILQNFGVHQRPWRIGLMQTMRSLYAASEN